MRCLLVAFEVLLYLGATASVLILIILLAKRLFKKAMSPKWHYYIWFLLIIRLLVPYTPESSLSIYNLLHAAAGQVNIPVGGLNNQSSSLTAGNSDLIIPVGNNTVKKENALDTSAADSGSGIALIGTSVPGYNMPLDIMALIWLFAVLLLILYTIGVNIAFAVQVKKSYSLLNDKRVNGILHNCKRRMKIKQPISLFTTKKSRPPSIYMLFHPKILVSNTYMDQLSDSEIEYILLHELFHYKRKDIALNWVITFLQIIYFFNPLIWYAFYRIREDCEISCDAEVLSCIGEEEYQSYGKTIIKLIGLLSESSFIPATAGICKNKSSYRRRIIMIGEFKKSKWVSTLAAAVIIVMVAVTGLTGCENLAGSTSKIDEANSKDNGSGTYHGGQIEENSELYYGEWVIDKVLAYGLAGTYSREEAESLIGKRLNFTADRASRFGDDASYAGMEVSNPKYTKTVISNDDFLIDYRMSLSKLGIELDSVTEIDVDDTEGNVSNFFIKDKNTLIIVGGNTYFELVKKVY